MLLKNSISITRKLFQKTLERFKSLLSPGRATSRGGRGRAGSYQKLPKTSPFNPLSCSRKRSSDMENVQASFEDATNKTSTSTCKEQIGEQMMTKEEGKENNTYKKQTTALPVRPTLYKKSNEESTHVHETAPPLPGPPPRHRRRRLMNIHEQVAAGRGMEMEEIRSRQMRLAQRLREMEIIDNSNVDHMFDTEEVLHYYSQLTCPAYMDIVDKFFVVLYAEFTGLRQQHQHQVSASRGKPNWVKPYCTSSHLV